MAKAEDTQAMEQTNEKIMERIGELERELAEAKAQGSLLQNRVQEVGSGREQAIFEKNLFAVMEKEKKDTVTVTLPIDMNGEDNEVFVGVNGYTYLIKRGEAVEVPRFVAKVLQNSEAQMISAIKTMNNMEEAAEEKMGRL